MKVAVIGCGKASRIYLDVLEKLPGVEVVACADLDRARAAQAAAPYPGIRVLSPADAMSAEDVGLVVNLTIPAAHAEVSLAALASGKHVYSEKPLALTVASGTSVLDQARIRGLRVGCAPDSVLGTGVQTARAVLDRGDIGTPLAATVLLLGHGPDNWHPRPAQFYQRGAGPLFDKGPYYIATLVTLLGPIRRVVAMGRTSFPDRQVSTGDNKGLTFTVEVDTHVSAVLEHTSGVLSTLVTSFDVLWGSRLRGFEVYGSEGTLAVPEPHVPAGPAELRRAGSDTWEPIPPAAGYTGLRSGVGVADLAQALRRGEQHRASGELALHVLDVMESILEAGRTGTAVELTTSCERPAPVPCTSPDDSRPHEPLVPRG